MIKKLPNNLTVDGDLNLEETEITEIPSSLTVKGVLTTPLNLTELPDNLTVGSLDVYDISELPENLTVTGTLNLIGTDVTKLPDSLKAGTIITDSPKLAKKYKAKYNIELDY